MSDTTRKPVLWALDFDGHQLHPDFAFESAAEAENYKRRTISHCQIVPLYRDPPPPTLTDAEREALGWSIKECEREAVNERSRAATGNYLDCPLRERQAMSRAATLRGLLARLGGDA